MARRSTRTAAKASTKDAKTEAAGPAEAPAPEDAPETEAATRVSVKARQAIRHDGKRYGAGDTFEVPPATRDELKALGAVE